MDNIDKNNQTFDKNRELMVENFKSKKLDNNILRTKLISEGKTRWLDIGCGMNLDSGFYYLDKYPLFFFPEKLKPYYTSIDLRHLTQSHIEKLGKFDFIRMQHVLEHMGVEDGNIALTSIAKLLKRDGLLLITTPDLRIHIEKYLNSSYKSWENFKSWARNRIQEDAPDSFYFSLNTHSIGFETHEWCYDLQGIVYQLEQTKEFYNIRELKLTDPLSSFPFTHNRPDEDVCVIAMKK